jgi:SAM-dependent methyltransferase
MNARVRFPVADPSRESPIRRAAGAAYDQAGDAYLAYADGDARRPFNFDSQYAYADRRVWAVIQAKLVERRKSGARTIRILDAGCGPGTWLRRIVARAHELGFTEIVARGFDIAEAQVRRARALSRDVARLPGVSLDFAVGDLTEPLPEADASIDLGLCLYCVLNHVPVARLPNIAAELARVTSGHFVTTVRAIGSTPTIYVDAMDKARQFHQDNCRDRFDVELLDGRHFAMDSHLFSARELRGVIADAFDIDEIRGLDIFHSRFAPDRRWNPASLQSSDQLYQELACLEETFSTDPNFIDRATHLLLVAHHRPTRRPKSRSH